MVEAGGAQVIALCEAIVGKAAPPSRTEAAGNAPAPLAAPPTEPPAAPR